MIIDWSAKGAVGPVRNQGQCGSWALYATLGTIEGLTKVTTGTLEQLSSQQLIDCTYGCNGGTISQGYTFYKTHGTFLIIQVPALKSNILRQGRLVHAKQSNVLSR